jgi:hypothetical protein
MAETEVSDESITHIFYSANRDLISVILKSVTSSKTEFFMGTAVKLLFFPISYKENFPQSNTRVPDI